MTTPIPQSPSVGDVLAGRKFGRHKRTHQPVRRNSYNVGERERRFWSPVCRRELRAIREAARTHDVVSKKPGARNGSLGHVALQVLDLLAGLVDWRTGRLEPAIAYMMEKLRRSRDAIVRALAALKREGFLEWIRRTEPIEDAEGAGPRVRQVTNAYRITRPTTWAKRIAMRIAQWRLRGEGGRAPAAAEQPGDPALAGALASLEASLKRVNASPPSGQNPGGGS